MKDDEHYRYVPDTSAIVALVENEDGAGRVEEILRSGAVILPFPVPLEVYYITVQEGGEARGNARYAMLKALPVTHLNEIDEPTLLTAGRFKAFFQLSLADALIAAFAARNDAVLVHKDPKYEPLRGLVRQEVLPYKSRRRR